MRVLICGGRHFDDDGLIKSELSKLHETIPIDVLIHGGLPTIGTSAENWARRNGVHLVRYPANFSLGKQGDVLRDRFMLEDGRADMLLVFPGGRRTAELRNHARRTDLQIFEVARETQGLAAAA